MGWVRCIECAWPRIINPDKNGVDFKVKIHTHKYRD